MCFVFDHFPKHSFVAFCSSFHPSRWFTLSTDAETAVSHDARRSRLRTRTATPSAGGIRPDPFAAGGRTVRRRRQRGRRGGVAGEERGTAPCDAAQQNPAAADSALGATQDQKPKAVRCNRWAARSGTASTAEAQKRPPPALPTSRPRPAWVAAAAGVGMRLGGGRRC